MKQIKWGMLATGTIAKKFATTARAMGDEAAVAAVASRDMAKAQAFAQEHGIAKAYGSYEELARDPEIDIVYISTPHAFHYENMMLCLRSGKSVLCEKSFTVTASQAKEVYALAREKGLLAMEAFWTAYLPAVAKVKSLLNAGAIGDLQFVSSQYGFRNDERRTRKFDPALAGGALLDIGVYNIGVACMVLGYKPEHILTQAIMNEVGTDSASSITLTYPGGKFAQLTTAIQTIVPAKAVFYGEKGHIIMPGVNSPQQIELVLNGAEPQIFLFPFEYTGFEYQIREAMRCVAEGKSETPLYPAENSIAVMEIMDKVREIWGMRFPFEEQ